MIEFRSLFFIPGANEKMLAKAAQIAADLIVFDLEDSVLEEQKQSARDLVAASLRELKTREETRARPLCVRVNALDSSNIELDLLAILPAQPDFIMLPKTQSGADLEKIDSLLAALELKNGLSVGQTKLIALTAETPGSLFRFDSLHTASDRLVGMSWGAEDLASELFATQSRSKGVNVESSYDQSSGWLPPFQLAQTLCLAKSRDLGVQPIDTVFANFRDLDGLREECLSAKIIGFSGKLAIHPSQVDVINQVFSPSDEEVAFAQKVVDLFSANPGVGAIQLEGRMLDIPHLSLAKRVLALSRSD